MAVFNATKETPKRRGIQILRGHVGKLQVGLRGTEEQGKRTDQGQTRRGMVNG